MHIIMIILSVSWESSQLPVSDNILKVLYCSKLILIFIEMASGLLNWPCNDEDIVNPLNIACLSVLTGSLHDIHSFIVK